MFSTDDTTEYIFEGIKGHSFKFVLVTKSSVKERGTKSLYKIDDSKAMNGMRVKLTFTFSAAGNCFPLVVTVTGLTEKEMPPEKDFIDIEIPGLCLGGGRVNLENKQVGHLLLMRNTEGAEKQRFQWYQEHILIPEVNRQREIFGHHDALAGNTIRDYLSAVSMCDGDLSQIYATNKSVPKLVENKITALKQNAARSAGEQPADLANVFSVIKDLLPSHTVKDFKEDECPFKKRICDVFRLSKLKYLSLKLSKKNALVDFLSVLPEIATKACSVKKCCMYGSLETCEDGYQMPGRDMLPSFCQS